MVSRKAMAWIIAGVLLTGLVMAAPGIADEEGRFGGDRGGQGLRGELSEGLGKGALLALAANAAYAPYKWLRPQLAVLRLLPLPLVLQVHIVAGLAALGLGTVHALLAEEGNAWLWLGLGLMGYETIGGLLMRRTDLSRRTRRGLLLLHAQRATLVLLTLALFVGHLLVSEGLD